MIIPSGKRKHQVLQGASKHNSIMDSDIFEKIAIGNLPGELPGNVTNKVDTGQVGDAMSQGGLDPQRHDRHDPQPGGDFDPSKRGIQPNAPQGPTEGAPGGGGAPADQFLGSAPVDPNEGINDPYAQEIQNIRDFIGHQKYGLKMRSGNDGSLEVTVIPPQGTPVDIAGLMQGLKGITQGKWIEESTPAGEVGGPLTIKYIPQGMQTNDKIMKPGKGGR